MVMEAWKEKASYHWMEFRPKMYAELVRTGKLDEALTKAVESTRREMDELQEALDLDELDAREAVRQRYILLPPEK